MAWAVVLAPSMQASLHACEVDEAVVDPVADHDGAEKGRLRVEVADAELGQSKRHRDCDQHGDPEREDRAQIAEEEKDGEEHEGGAEQRSRGDVVEDRLVVGDEEREGAAEGHPQMVALQLDAAVIDDRLHPVDERARLRDVERSAGRAHDQRDRAVVGRHHEAVLVAREPLGHLRRRRVVVVERDRERVRLRLALLQLVAHGIARLLQIVERHEERPVVLEPVAHRRDRRLDAADLLGPQREEVPRQQGRHRFRFLQALGPLERLDQHQHRAVAADALDQLLDLPHRRHVLGKQLFEAGADFQLAGQRHAPGRQRQSREQEEHRMRERSLGHPHDGSARRRRDRRVRHAMSLAARCRIRQHRQCTRTKAP